jgi:hypothetical protein
MIIELGCTEKQGKKMSLFHGGKSFHVEIKVCPDEMNMAG